MEIDARINRLTWQIIKCAIKVHSALGPGLLESAYQACLLQQLHISALHFAAAVRIPLSYEGVTLECAYIIDVIVEDTVILELKVVEKILPVHEAQLLTYLKLTGKPIGLLLNFNVPRMKDGIVRRVNTKPGGGRQEIQE